MQLKKKNYLNNRDILAEIHKSKNSYCSYLDNEDANYDIILPSLDHINNTTIDQAKKNRADRLARSAWQQAINRGETCKLEEFAIDPAAISNQDLVFRINTYEHIPTAPHRKKNPKYFIYHTEAAETLAENLNQSPLTQSHIYDRIVSLIHDNVRILSNKSSWCRCSRYI